MASISMNKTITLLAASGNKLRAVIISLCNRNPDYAAWFEVAFWRLSQTEDGQYWSLSTASPGHLRQMFLGLFEQMPRAKNDSMALFGDNHVMVHTQTLDLGEDVNLGYPTNYLQQSVGNATHDVRSTRAQSHALGLETPRQTCWQVPGVGGESQSSTIAEDVDDFDLSEYIDMSRVGKETSGSSFHGAVEQRPDLHVVVDSILSTYPSLKVSRTPVVVGDDQVFYPITPVEGSTISCY